ncbi:MAG: bifunctional proline dehydrogenase/L-glutamate gamma-semialdehyde dehydrogenase, partial [Methylococcaceae bacterium]|nr:bifunctional proline dehydrogenase/L-glutamate gamma-semialdehyde dehydrogenase [Methylococcaceae bacterium]
MKNAGNTINQDFLANESEMIKRLLDFLADYDSVTIHHQAQLLVSAIRDKKDQQTLVEAFLHEYRLNSEEGLVLMEIAEALLRIPDQQTQDQFLQEKLTRANWYKHLQQSDSLLVNFTTQALDITAKVENSFELTADKEQRVFSRLSSRIGLPLIRTALKQAMQQLAYQFVIAETIDQALSQAQGQSDYLYSFDMLGEAALTASDAERYFNAYALAIKHLAEHARHGNPFQNPGISIKLSALCP